jgi:hypothetical protein
MTEPKPSNTNNDLMIYRLDEIKAEIVDIKRQYVTKEESLALKTEIQSLRDEVYELKKNRSLIGWLYPTASAAFSAIVTYLLIEYFRNSK